MLPLTIGLFVVFLPSVLVSQQMTRSVPAKDFWKATLRGLPRSLQIAFYGLFAYAGTDFVLVLAWSLISNGTYEPMRLYSGHAMFFYFAAFAMTLSALRVAQLDESLTCPNGQKIPSIATYCFVCGRAVQQAQ
jgi:hypothetical protein